MKTFLVGLVGACYTAASVNLLFYYGKAFFSPIPPEEDRVVALLCAICGTVAFVGLGIVTRLDMLTAPVQASQTPPARPKVYSN